MSTHSVLSRAGFLQPLKQLRLATVLVVSSAFAVSCGGGSSGDGGGGIIGTGIQLKGAVPTNRAFAESTIEIKARTGEKSTATIASNGQFTANNVQGDGPYLLRVNLGNGFYYYGISHAINAASATQNVHAYSDVVIRNWFARNGLDIDSTFAGTDPIGSLPSQTEIAAIDADVNALIAPALDAYGLGATNLQNVEFAANDTGVDRFLDRNPVIVNNGVITIVITDPTDSTASTVATNLAIGTDFSAIDTQPPSEPKGVRALASASNQIVVAWESSSDNVAVVRYEVLRDGTAIAETPFPVFIDTGLQSDIVYEYAVVAIDPAGNRSAVSSTAGTKTLAAPDVTPPPGPTGVQLSAEAASINIRWTQSDIVDVASFTLLRGEAGAMLDTLVRVTSTAFDDVGLNSGTEYCYQLITRDASENESPASDVVCATTTGSAVTTATPVPGPTNNPTTNPDPTPGTGLDYLLAVDVSSTSCTKELADSEINGTVTLSAGCYLVSSDLSLDDGDLLTLSPGTILKFGSSTGLRVNTGASLTAVGTEANPIVLSGQQPTPGYWNGVEFAYSNNLKNQLVNVVIEYAGAGSGSSAAALKLTANSISVTRVSASRLLLRHSLSNGFSFNDNSILDGFDDVISTSNKRSGRTAPELAGSIGASGQFTGNEIDAIRLTNDVINDATTLPNLGVPWLADSINVEAPVDIAAGNTIMFDALGSVTVRDSGSLRADGTEAAPITFTASEMTPGYWEGIVFTYSPSANNLLNHVVIEYAGSGSSSTASALKSTANSSYPTRIDVNNTILRNSGGYGFYLDAGTIIADFSNTTSVGNDRSGVMAPVALSNMGSGLNLQGNTLDAIVLFVGDVATPQTWPALGVPYRFSSLTLNDSLTLSPGTTLVAANGGTIRVNEEGSLKAIGTTAAPISFIGEQATPGYWEGIDYSYTNSVENVLEHVVVSDAGGGGAASNNGNLELTCNSSYPAQVSVSNSSITNSAGWGIFASDSGCTVNVGASVTLTGNSQGTVNITP